MPSTRTDDLAAIERLVESLQPETRTALETMSPVARLLGRKWLPNPGPQTEAYHSQADELFYGGQAGGGKSDILMGLALTAHRQSLLLRRTTREAGAFIKRFADIVGHRDGWNGQLSRFTLPGRMIEFGGCQLEEDKQKYKGDPHDLIGFDEISDFSETQYRFIIGWNRSAERRQRCRVVACGNPPTRPEGLWVVKYWAAWLDPTHPDPAKPGELRWFTTIDGEDTEVDGPGPHEIAGEAKPVMARSRTFIPAELGDNPDLAEGGYAAVLAALPEDLRDAYRDGRFDRAVRDDAFQTIPTAWIMAAQARWRPDGHGGVMMTAIGLDPAGGGADAAAIAARYGGWYAPLVAERGPATADGSAMAGLVLRHRRDSCPIVIDVGGGYAGAVITRFKDNDIPYQRFDGAAASAATARGTGLRFASKRAEAYWRLREELDPDQDGGSPIALPPDAELRADLAAPRYALSARGIQLEAKDEIRARIGRSPNKGDAVAMALSEGNKAALQRSGPGRTGRRVVLGYNAMKGRW
jgi:hypothetical protein